ncbi:MULTISPECIES: DUF3721 domain-containing protein [unclassified Synechococcus]|uniref:DUF3721 domain-containing protein n=1 Tax=unclassified Synechococcus TaxID=2626047 RepID=UPI0028F4553B|nr:MULTISPECIES: DUF3721 domain-containing protein [unclassified Synechococcus]
MAARRKRRRPASWGCRNNAERTCWPGCGSSEGVVSAPTGAADQTNSWRYPEHKGVRPNLYTYPSKQVALQKAKELGCEGVHPMGSLWMPCREHPQP